MNNAEDGFRFESTDRVYGFSDPRSTDNVPKEKDASTIDAINHSLEESGADSMQFPYVSTDASNEYDAEANIFCKAFPWLFPGGVGDVNGLYRTPISPTDWAHRLTLYEDGRFAKDKAWCFYALNWCQRHQNNTQGSFFVNSFYQEGPQNLEELQKQISQGNTKWIDQICYFSKSVTGSAAYWRQRRREVYSWIHYHIHRGNGPPNLFLTFSCAEHYWPDIKNLLAERYRLAKLPTPNINDEKIGSTIVNEMTVVIQEYFQKRIQHWLKTIGKNIFGINHYWLKYEFAPARGQIHTHMLAISSKVKDIAYNAYVAKHNNGEIDESAEAEILYAGFQKLSGWTASIPTNLAPTKIKKCDLPSRKLLSQTRNKLNEDLRDFLCTTQNYVCTSHCLKKRKFL